MRFSFLRWCDRLVLALVFAAGLSACSAALSIDEAKVKADLMGQVVRKNMCTWQFAKPEEIQNLKITGQKTDGAVRSVVVVTDLIDLDSNRQFHADLTLVYRLTGDQWQLATVAADNFTPSCVG